MFGSRVYMDGQKLDISELPDDELIVLMYEILNEVESRLMYQYVESGNAEN